MLNNMFQTSAKIRKCAEDLIASLGNLKDARGTKWTKENFRRLEAFAKSQSPDLKSYYRKKGKTKEFLWDFIASGDMGLFIVAESEQQVRTRAHVKALKHDFEKLLYVYSPIRILITKARDRSHARRLPNTLASYANRCRLSYNPGASFILHFGLYNGAGNVSYHWQSRRKPKARVSEKIAFELVSDSSHAKL